MIPGFTSVTFFVLWAADVSQSVLITQWPHYISSPPSGSAEMHCYQNDTDYPYLFWYRQPKGESFQFIVSVVAGTVNYEEGFKSGFQALKSSDKQWSLTITSIQHKDEAVYLCATSLHSANEAYFGQGTKLTVLDPELTVTRPTVKVLQPSAKECKNSRGNAEKTIVCLATGFYPDHVSVSWQVGGVDTIPGVATDNAALQGEDKYYTITSRLRVSAKEWYNPNTEFKCTVSFFNGTDTKSYSDSVSGEEAKEGVLTREKYLKIAQTAKLSYGVFIVKSMVYGVFVAFLVWKLQNSSGKRNH
ncbi:M1-specific T cell receptor beta chain-like [Epinephelus fuscoguttatus]|uniref:M1-specific T cell receptor beta chain-like n=1 Tax=Epinephelus fuscoguttatus TaxID=293821 RepID=UPI0020D1397A|nr:M1-specific T cell receptor beta chain-like [Epinephelus fuscoguttatus]